MNATTIADDSLKWLLRVVGGVELFAIPFVFFPVPWMAFVHAHIPGLGVMPESPVVEYLARSLSALYAVHGAMIVRLSFDVARYRPAIGFLGRLHVILGLTVLGIDLAAGLPWFWVAMEGPGITVGGGLIVWLSRAEESAQVP